MEQEVHPPIIVLMHQNLCDQQEPGTFTIGTENIQWPDLDAQLWFQEQQEGSARGFLKILHGPGAGSSAAVGQT
jgi:hypothetical protein